MLVRYLKFTISMSSASDDVCPSQLLDLLMSTSLDVKLMT